MPEKQSRTVCPLRIVRTRFVPLLSPFFLILLAGMAFAQSGSNPTKSSRQATPKSAAAWQDDRFAVRLEEPYISKAGLLVLAYTLTNKSGTDLVVYREGHGKPTDILKGDEEVKLFRRLKTSGDYDEVTENDQSVSFFRTSLPADVPVRMLIAFRLPKDEESWWSKKAEVTPRKAIERILSDVDAVVILVPARRIRIILPVRPNP